MVVVDTTMEWQAVSKAVCAGSNMSLVGVRAHFYVMCTKAAAALLLNCVHTLIHASHDDVPFKPLTTFKP